METIVVVKQFQDVIDLRAERAFRVCPDGCCAKIEIATGAMWVGNDVTDHGYIELVTDDAQVRHLIGLGLESPDAKTAAAALRTVR